MIISSNNSINIVFVIWTLEGMAGSERVVYDIVRNLNKNTYSILIISFKDGPVRQLYESLGVQVQIISKKKRINLGFIGKFRRLLLDWDTKIVNAHHFSPFLYSFLATRFTGMKLVYTEHSRWQLEQLGGAKRIMNRILLKKTDAIVAISNQIQDYYLNTLYLNNEKVFLIINGIDWARFQNSAHDSLREELGIKADEKVVGMVANLRPEKNHKLLISAFSKVAQELRNVRLVLVGLDCMQGEIHRLAATSDISDKILILGERNDVPDLLKAFDVFCLPSIYEGLPLTILEAMAAGVPVIGSDVIGINEVISHNVNGILFPKNHEMALAENIKRLLVDDGLRIRLAKEGQVFVRRNYSIDEKIKEYDELFRGLCSRHTNPILVQDIPSPFH